MEKIVLKAYVYQMPCKCQSLQVYGPDASTITCPQCKRWWSRNLGRVIQAQDIVVEREVKKS